MHRQTWHHVSNTSVERRDANDRRQQERARRYSRRFFAGFYPAGYPWQRYPTSVLRFTLPPPSCFVPLIILPGARASRTPAFSPKRSPSRYKREEEDIYVGCVLFLITPVYRYAILWLMLTLSTGRKLRSIGRFASGKKQIGTKNSTRLRILNRYVTRISWLVYFT